MRGFKGICKQPSAAFKAEVALEVSGQKRTIATLAKQHQHHPVQFSHWKNPLLDGVEDQFEKEAATRQHDLEKLQNALYEQINRLQMKVPWVKKNEWLRFKPYSPGMIPTITTEACDVGVSFVTESVETPP